MVVLAVGNQEPPSIVCDRIPLHVHKTNMESNIGDVVTAASLGEVFSIGLKIPT